MKRGTSPGRPTSTSTRRRRTSPPLTATRSISRKSCDELRERQHLYVESSGRRRSRGIAKDFQTVAKRPARFQEEFISYKRRRDISQIEKYSPPENLSGAVLKKLAEPSPSSLWMKGKRHSLASLTDTELPESKHTTYV